ncbi:MAG: ABC transporter ATP-binding protein [Sulfuricaulis sp.]|nr:ABC transporter ATP-binding protein [Sulfuricaulis sp.]
MSAISISGLHKRYPRVHALTGIDLEIERGEFFGLLGPNGAGKSTLINIVAGLTRFDTGRVTVLDRDVVSDYRSTRRLIGVVPQELAFDPFFNVREVLRIQSGYFGLRANDAWIDELMTALMLNEKAETNMRALSGGMKRRVMIAQALVHKPEVVVLDEPTAGVDVQLRKSLWTFIRRLHREGHTIVLTTHYLEEAEALCERIAILNHGEIVALDTKHALMARGIGHTRRVCITTQEPLGSLPEGLARKVLRQEGNQIELQLDKTTDSVIAVLDALRSRGAVITDLSMEGADLEDVFVELTQRQKP